jgi:chorismate mutase
VADEELRLLRSRIDRIDDQLLRLLASRLEVSEKIAQVKARDNLAVFQPKRWDSLLQQRLSEAIDLGLEQEFVKEIFEKIHAESVRVQMNAKG